MVKKKSMWSVPKLIALVRSKPAESVLAFCKRSSGMTGPDSYNTQCASVPTPPMTCGFQCNDMQPS